MASIGYSILVAKTSPSSGGSVAIFNDDWITIEPLSPKGTGMTPKSLESHSRVTFRVHG
jgi:hypothetical protein